MKEKEKRTELMKQMMEVISSELKENIEKAEKIKVNQKQETLRHIEQLINEMTSMPLKQNEKIQMEQKGVWIRVENIPKRAKQAKVIELFTTIGTVLNDIEIVDGTCVINYENKSDAINACKLNNRKILNSQKVLSVHFISSF